jgi:Ankyrin repeats (3 copies)
MKILLDGKCLQTQAHFHYEKAKGQRLAAFIEMLQNLAADTTIGFIDETITKESLNGVDVFVQTTRDAPITDEEIVVIQEFVNSGGGLLIMSNHAPHHPPSARLAACFGVELEGGFFLTDGVRTTISGSDLTDHPIISAGDGKGSIKSLVTNTTDSIRANCGRPLAYLPTAMRFLSTDISGRDRVYALAIDGPTDISPSTAGRVIILADSGFVGGGDTRYPGIGLFDQGGNGEFMRRIVLWLTGEGEPGEVSAANRRCMPPPLAQLIEELKTSPTRTRLCLIDVIGRGHPADFNFVVGAGLAPMREDALLWAPRVPGYPGEGESIPEEDMRREKRARIVKMLIEMGGDPNYRNEQGATPLHMAARYGQDLCAQTLIAAGADINALDANDETPHDLAVKLGHSECADVLVRQTGSE